MPITFLFQFNFIAIVVLLYKFNILNRKKNYNTDERVSSGLFLKTSYSALPGFLDFLAFPANIPNPNVSEKC